MATLSNQRNGDNLNNIRLETSRHFRNKKREYLLGIINDLETNSANKNFRRLHTVINEFKNG